jgi:outer membrane biosynthesis protein TonB
MDPPVSKIEESKIEESQEPKPEPKPELEPESEPEPQMNQESQAQEELQDSSARTDAIVEALLRRHATLGPPFDVEWEVAEVDPRLYGFDFGDDSDDEETNVSVPSRED